MLVGTLDTKGVEYGFLRERLQAAGVDTVLVDAGIVGPALAEPDIAREQVAAAAGHDVEALRAAGDRGAAVIAMAEGATEVVRRLHDGGALRRRAAARRLGRHRRSRRRRCARCRSACRS